MKIFVVDPSLFTAQYDHHFCEALAQEGHEVTFFARPIRLGEIHYRSTYKQRNIFYNLSEAILRKLPQLSFLVKILKGFEHAYGLLKFWIIIKKERPDIIHWQWLILPWIDRFFINQYKKMQPVILTVHDTQAFLGSPTSKLQLFGWNKALHGFDHLLVHTEHSLNELLKQNFKKDRISLIPMGTFDFIHLNKTANVFVEKLKQEHSKKVIVTFFGVIKPYKGVDVLLKAWAQVPIDVRLNAHLVISGKPGQDIEELKGLAKSLNLNNEISWDLRFVPEDEIPALARASNIFVFPYRQIDASAVFMSFIKYGKAIIATQIGVFAEIIESGKSGILIPPEDSTALAKALSRLLLNSEERLSFGQAIKERSEIVQSLQSFAQESEMMYHSVLEKNKA